jgi:hypothetical protein
MKIMKLALVTVLSALALSPAPATAAPERTTGPITVNVQAFTPAYVRAVQRCMSGDEARQSACQKQIPAERCLRVERWFDNGSFEVVRDEC